MADNNTPGYNLADKDLLLTILSRTDELVKTMNGLNTRSLLMEDQLKRIVEEDLAHKMGSLEKENSTLRTILFGPSGNDGLLAKVSEQGKQIGDLHKYLWWGVGFVAAITALAEYSHKIFN